MLSDFVTEHRQLIIERCRARVSARMSPRPTAYELEHGLPLFLDQLVMTLKARGVRPAAAESSATKHGGDLLRQGFTIAQVVRDYGDVCQTITALAIELRATITNEEFRELNWCLDEAIAEAVTEFGRQHEINVTADVMAQGDARATEELGMLAHELRNLLGTAILATDALRNGSVGISGSTGAVLVRSLAGMHELIDRSFAVVRLKAGIGSPERIVIRDLIGEIEVTAMMQARERGHQFSIEAGAADVAVLADRHVLASIVSNLVQNAFKYTRPTSAVVLRSTATAERVVIEVEDQCGGLPQGRLDTLFNPFVQHSVDSKPEGLGLGLAICQRGAKAIGGEIRVRDMPGHGCVFTLELPRARVEPAPTPLH